MAFASTDDVAARLARSLTDEETTAIGFLLEGAQAAIELAVDEVEANLGVLPPVLRFVTVEIVCRALGNPSALISEQEGLGAYSHSARFREEVGLALTQTEELMVRRAVWGTNSGTGQAQSLANDLCVLCGLAPSICDGEWLCGCDGS